MKFAILSLAAAGALTFSAGSALAGPPGHYHGGHYHGGYNSFHPIGPHLDYHRGHYHYHDGFYRSAPLVPVYPSYSYPIYGSGFGATRPGFSITIGSGGVPYYGGYGGYYGRRW
jgi:hypothetical protein